MHKVARNKEESRAKACNAPARYPGGKFFDPFGFSRGNPEKLDEYKLKEVKNGRLAILVS